MKLKLPFLFASIGSVIPAFTSIADLHPPLLKEITFVTTGLCVLYFIKTSRSDDQYRTMEKKGTIFILASSILFLCYVTLRENSTITIPETGYYEQVGFSRLDWSLTEDARADKNDSCKSKIDLVEFRKCTGHFENNLIWKEWSIYLAGILLLLCFLLSSVFWTIGWVHISKLTIP